LSKRSLTEARCTVYWLKSGAIGKIEIVSELFDEKEVDTTSEEFIKYRIELGN
jgi:hypothetical protein